MIDANNLSQVLEILGFIKQGQVWTKHFIGLNCSMSVDFKNRRLIYPDDLLGRERNAGFDKKENFVVFECVCRLIDKGYRPKDIELEREWHLGHDPKSGRGDICVSNPDGTLLFIIECKTYGKEYDNALKDTKNDGGQLFSYWQQEGSTKWLMLYTADLNNNSDIAHKAEVINCSDDQNIIQLAKKDKSIKLYINAHTANERYEVWIDTYEGKFYDDIILSEETVAYQIGVKPLRKKDLRDFTPEDSIVNQFEEILRHNNVSDKENAFNRLVALFICKLVDEINKGEDDEVEFQYKQGTDDYESLQDRLQRLHRDGMDNFMHEHVFYIEPDYPENLFQQYTGSKRKEAIEDLKRTIRCLKYYSNNDFAFKDVHNEELFLQNGKILVEMVQLFEKYRIVYPSKHQFLGDLFEQLLNKGFKQNEGQFFTPTPITRFIWDSLPIESRICTDRGVLYPKIIDYACGAGHFLTEAIEAINYYAKNNGNNDWVRNHIYGIEKDYRLARVAKISLFMNGAGEGNIIFGDGLDNVPDKAIESGSFDILVANPPYAVKYFAQHLDLKNNHLELLSSIGRDSDDIEVLFVERIAQLLKPQGIAAVILPSPILNNNGCYIKAREELLKHFYIRGIVSFGAKTFGETGMNTVVMFLEKYNEPPQKMKLMSDTSVAILSGDGIELTDWADRNILDQYLKRIGVSEEKYNRFAKHMLSIEEFQEDPYFKMYVNAFENSSEWKNQTKKKSYQKMAYDEQQKLKLSKLYTYIREVEGEKIYYFALIYDQKTVIIQAPTDNKAQVEFLGYNWSKSKGNEGIQIISPGGKLYNDADRRDDSTLAAAIRHSFLDETPTFTEEQSKYSAIVKTPDMFDFSRDSFNKAFMLSASKQNALQSKYSSMKLSEIAPYVEERITLSNLDFEMYISTDNMIKNRGGITVYEGEPIIQSAISYQTDDILVSNIRPYLKKIWFADRNGGASPDVLVFRIIDTDIVLPKYLYYILSTDMFFDFMMANHKGAKMPRGDKSIIPQFTVPVPPRSTQQDIVNEIEDIEAEYKDFQKDIKQYQNRIDELMAFLDSLAASSQIAVSLSDKNLFSIDIGKRVVAKELVYNGNIPVYSANVYEPFGYVDKLLISDFSLPSILWGIDGDWMTSYMPENVAFYPTDHCGVLRCLTNDVHPRYMAHLLENEGKKIGFSRNLRASIDRIEGIKISVPSIEDQEKIISQVIELEQKISETQNKIDSMNGKTTEILNKYLS